MMGTALAVGHPCITYASCRASSMAGSSTATKIQPAPQVTTMPMAPLCRARRMTAQAITANTGVPVQTGTHMGVRFRGIRTTSLMWLLPPIALVLGHSLRRSLQHPLVMLQACSCRAMRTRTGARGRGPLRQLYPAMPAMYVHTWAHTTTGSPCLSLSDNTHTPGRYSCSPYSAVSVPLGKVGPLPRQVRNACRTLSEPLRRRPMRQVQINHKAVQASAQAQTAAALGRLAPRTTKTIIS